MILLPEPLDWIKCNNGSWCNFMHVDLNNVKTRGIYWIWCDGYYQLPEYHLANTVYIGQGNIAERIIGHRKNPRITEYNDRDRLLVTWAHVMDEYLNAVEGYFCTMYKPRAMVRCPDINEPVYINNGANYVNTPFY